MLPILVKCLYQCYLMLTVKKIVYLFNPLLEYIQKLNYVAIQLPCHMPGTATCTSLEESNLKEHITHKLQCRAERYPSRGRYKVQT